jgi:hypothetical protein
MTGLKLCCYFYFYFFRDQPLSSTRGENVYELNEQHAALRKHRAIKHIKDAYNRGHRLGYDTPNHFLERIRG